MAGDWLKFDKSTPDKPEVFEIASQLQIDPDSVVGKLMRVWSWFDSHTEDGNALRVTPALLDRCAGHVGFVAAMETVGWMVVENGGCRLPKFDRHCGATAKKRALGKNRTQKSRSGNASSVTGGVTASITKASPEKRREEKKEQELPEDKSSGRTAIDGDLSAADRKATLWRRWKQTSGDNGSLLGKMCKAHGEAAVLDAVEKVLTLGPAEPKAYLQRVLVAAAEADPLAEFMVGAI